jgi:hypothetical protein
MSTIYYAGIGSRQTPESILGAFKLLGERLGEMGCVLRSGRAPGADSSFEEGAIKAHANSEIFVPWKGFPKGSALSRRPAILFDFIESEQKQRALTSVNTYHPAPERLSPGALKLMARNYCQMFGPTASSDPSSFVVCYTSNGKASGGTGQAIRMAQSANIPVFNAFGYESNPDAFVTLVVTYVTNMLQEN